ncbi:hypothetical protein GCM10022226_37410 [Sphaerisporangium flaviroseum]|uniref:Uncharacterized protein n=1 Tax=Sphaerisporangium flaviroseum TaxID=509199 RepID=A0ABP7I9Z8_9ACTN
MTVWQPYVDDPLFTPALPLGYAALPAVEAERLVRYLEAVAARRGILHTAVAFNAVYFGYDIHYGGYPGGPVDFDRFSVIPTGDVEVDVPPVGAMVNFTAGSEPLYAEVVYKEGAHPLLGEDGSLPGWVSGAPFGATSPEEGPAGDVVPVAAERIVADFHAFGQELTVTRARLERLRRKGQGLEVDGHLLVRSRARTAADAAADDLELYVRYLLGPARGQLLDGPLPMILADDAKEEALTAALRGVMRTIDEALNAAESLRRWRHYAFSRAALAARLGDDGPLGGGDLRIVASALGKTPETSRRRFGPADTITYTAIGPRLRMYNGASSRLQGIDYATAVCHANTVISDDIRGSADEKNVLPSGVHLRLDDTWQGGGVWRASYPPGPYADVDPLTPLGLGWLGQLPDAPPEELVDEPIDETDDSTLLSVSDSQLSWTLPLRLSHTLQGTAPLPKRVAEEMTYFGLADAAVRLRLRHDGSEFAPADAEQEVRVERTGAALRLTGVDWPLEFFPGIVLTFSWSRGAPTLNATSTLLDGPVLFDGDLIEHLYAAWVLTRDRAPGLGQPGEKGPDTLRARVLRAIRRVGLLDPEGVAALARECLDDVVFDAELTAGARPILEPVVTELIDTGVLQVERGGRDGRGMIRLPAREGDAPVEILVWRPAVTPFFPKGDDGGDSEDLWGDSVETSRERERPDDQSRLIRFLRPYEVQPFLRRLRPGHHATDEARAEYRRIRERYGYSGELPPGYTLVRGHRRGG